MANTSGYFGFSCMGWDTADAVNLYQVHSASGAVADNTNFTATSHLVGGGMYVMP
jgi:hypothetical protein